VTSPHARFESLCGAIALGEASVAERDEFARHAADCALCSGEPADAALIASITAAREAETWRPSMERSILSRIRDERSHRSKWIVGALGWAAAASIGLNVLFVTGFGAKATTAFFDATTVSGPQSAPVGMRLPPQTFATIARRPLAPRAGVPAPVDLAARRLPPRRSAPAATIRMRKPAAPASLEAPDIFAGLALEPRSAAAARSVAVEPLLRCDPAVRPCARADELHVSP